MQTSYTDEVPVADVRGQVVAITLGGINHPVVCAPHYVVREFCEVTIRKLDAWEAEQAGRVVPLGKRGGDHG